MSKHGGGSWVVRFESMGAGCGGRCRQAWQRSRRWVAESVEPRAWPEEPQRLRRKSPDDRRSDQGRLRRLRPGSRGRERSEVGRESTQARGGPRAVCCHRSPLRCPPSFTGLAAVDHEPRGLTPNVLPDSAVFERPSLQATQEWSCSGAEPRTVAWSVAPVGSASWATVQSSVLDRAASWPWPYASHAPVSRVAVVSARAQITASGEVDRRSIRGGR